MYICANQSEWLQYACQRRGAIDASAVRANPLRFRQTPGADGGGTAFTTQESLNLNLEYHRNILTVVITRTFAALFVAGVLLGNRASAGEPSGSPLTVGGAIRFNYIYKSWQDDYRSGFFGLDTARLDLNYDDGKLIGSAQYRYNHFPKGQGGYWQHFLHHGWIGMRFSGKSELHAGLDRNPFGLLPLASNNFYESIAFYAGLEDKYDLGVSYLSRPGPFEWQLAFYPRDGGSYGGGSNTAGKSNRYSYNIVPDDEEQGFGTGQRDSERNTLVGRMAWHVGPGGNYEIGVSGLTGSIDNGSGARTRRHAMPWQCTPRVAMAPSR
jgi:hypothetical protein